MTTENVKSKEELVEALELCIEALYQADKLASFPERYPDKVPDAIQQAQYVLGR